MDRRFFFLAFAAVALGVPFGYLLSSQASCPFAPPDLSHEWEFLGCSGGVAHYATPSDPLCLAKAIGKHYTNILYYAYVDENYPVDLNVPVERNGPAVLLIVPGLLSPVSYMIVSSGRLTHIFVSRTSVTKETHPFSWGNRICPSLPFNILTESEVVSREVNETVHYCFVQVNRDFNSVFDYLSESGALIGTILGRTYFRLDGNLIAYAVPTGKSNVTGITFYRVVEREE